MSQYEINKVSLEIDMEDADFQDRYMEAFDEMDQEEKKLLKIGKQSDITRAYCRMYTELFDNIFGKGTGEALFSGKENSRVCEETFERFLDICRKQVQDSAKRRRQLKAKYMPCKKR